MSWKISAELADIAQMRNATAITESTTGSLSSSLGHERPATRATGPGFCTSCPGSTADLTSDMLCPQTGVRRLEQAAWPEDKHDHHHQVDPVAPQGRVVDLEER